MSKPLYNVFCFLLLGFVLFNIKLGYCQNNSEVRVKPGDAIHIMIYEGGFMTQGNRFASNFHDTDLIIDGYGYIDIPPLEKAYIAGKNSTEISRIITDKFKPYAKDPMVIVTPLIRITLSGEFNKQGLYRFDPNISFWDMIEQAGGLRGLGTAEDIFLIRNDEIVYKNFNDALYNGTSLHELGIQSGDILVAPRINRLTFSSIIRYFNFGISVVMLYLTILNRND